MIGDLAGWRATLSPERPAVFWRGEWLSYGALDARAARLAARLAAKGIAAGDRVAILARNHLAHLDLMLAAPKLGFVHVPFNYRLSAAELRALASAVEPKLVLHDRAHEEGAQAIGEAAGAPRLPLECYAGWLEKPARPLSPREPNPDDIHMILFTGGSTGLPKGACLPYRQTCGNAITTVRAWDMTGADCAVHATPAFHAAVNVLSTPLLHAGGRVIWTETFEPAEYLALAATHRATMMFMVPTMFQTLAGHPDFATTNLANVRFVMGGGAPCPPGLREAFHARGLPFQMGYGLTECGVNCFQMPADEARRFPESVGRPMPGLQAMIRARDGAPLGPGEIGELTLKGPVVCAGYLGQPEETAVALRDGWLWTGDLARTDVDGRFYICGRRKEMYISGGENVYPAEVEAALSQCAGVSECAVIGIPHGRWGETGLAAVAPRAGAKLSADLLRAELKERLASYKLPSEFLFLDALPKTGAGKVAKPQLRALYESSRARA